LGYLKTAKRKAFLFLLVFLSVLGIFSSIGTFHVIDRSIAASSGWSKTYDEMDRVSALSIIESANNELLVVGGQEVLTQNGVYDLQGLAVKVSSEGNILWNRTFGSIESDIFKSEVETADGNFVIAGTTNATGTNDMWLVKIDPSGIVIWSKMYGNTDDESAEKVIITNDGGFMLAGFKSTGIASLHDFWLVKTDVVGNQQWNRTYGSTSNDILTSIVCTSDGGYAFVGLLGSLPWIAKVDETGNMQWNRTSLGTTSDTFGSIIRTNDQGFAIVGGNSAGYKKALLVKIDSTGVPQWNKTYDMGVGASSIVQTTDNGYAIAGNIAGGIQGGSWVAKTDLNGNLEWNQTFVGQGSSYVIQTMDANFVVLGNTSPSGTLRGYFWLTKIIPFSIQPTPTPTQTPIASEFPIAMILPLLASLLLMSALLRRKHAV
jgi:hypothetical protein